MIKVIPVWNEWLRNLSLRLFGLVDRSNGNYSLLTPLDPLPRGCKSIFTLVPGEECEGIFGIWVCLTLSVWTHNSKIIAPIDLLFTTEMLCPWLDPPSMMIWIMDSRICLRILGDRIKVCHDVKREMWWKLALWWCIWSLVNMAVIAFDTIQ